MVHFVSVSTFRKLDIDDNEVARLIKEFAQESKSGQIVVHDIYNNLEVSPTSPRSS